MKKSYLKMSAYNFLSMKNLEFSMHNFWNTEESSLNSPTDEILT